jgi:hypothetical protein
LTYFKFEAIGVTYRRRHVRHVGSATMVAGASLSCCLIVPASSSCSMTKPLELCQKGECNETKRTGRPTKPKIRSSGECRINTGGKIMNRRSVLTMMAIGVIGFCANNRARADEVLKFHMFVHGTSIQTQEVGDVEGHILAVGRFSGQAAFSDGSVGAATLNFTSEYGEHVKGVGTFHTYFSVTPSKDSTLWIKVDGTGKPEGTTTVFPEAPAIVVGGTGRFEGAKGDGKFVGGVRLTPIATGAQPELWNEFVINVKK